MALAVPEIVQVLESRGLTRYGAEAVSHLEHALQCATLAEREGADPPLVGAALLHDFGHLMERDLDASDDDVHQWVALPFLRVLPDCVLQPIRLHVDAKRYLCRVDPDYRARLSPASRASLALQGGVFSETEEKAFTRHAFAGDAIRLRLWDDRAKRPGAATRPLTHFEPLLHTLCLS